MRMLIPEIPSKFISELAESYEIDEFIVMNILDKTFAWIRATFPKREIANAFYEETNKCSHIHNAGWPEPCDRTEPIASAPKLKADRDALLQAAKYVYGYASWVHMIGNKPLADSLRNLRAAIEQAEKP